ncbi:hypothetical protein ACIRVK_04575 [Streptomyces sp. NPDC101152]|uniref:hypothetical protein n=1 Tax=Streptomyces sp. NPDC101152 TaxID=3366116 RepID=UPI0038262D89
MLRTAVGRRALQVALLVGGLFALGFLCGEQAHAADESPLASSPTAGPLAGVPGVRSLTEHTVGHLVPAPPAPAAATAPSDPGRPASAHHRTAVPSPRRTYPDPVTAPLTQGLGARVLHPVGELAVAVTDEVGKATGRIPPLSSLPTLPVLPTGPWSPSVPEPPGLPSLPSPPGLPASPVLPLPVPQPGGAGLPTAGGSSAGGRSGVVAVAVRGVTYGPWLATGVVGGHDPAQRDEQRAAGARHVPLHPAPDGDPTGAQSGHSAVDNGSSRHGDAQAVSPDRRAPLCLPAGHVSRTDAAVTGDVHRDIPVSPA